MCEGEEMCEAKKKAIEEHKKEKERNIAKIPEGIERFKREALEIGVTSVALLGFKDAGDGVHVVQCIQGQAPEIAFLGANLQAYINRKCSDADEQHLPPFLRGGIGIPLGRTGDILELLKDVLAKQKSRDDETKEKKEE
jgi:hypothetical protein